PFIVFSNLFSTRVGYHSLQFESSSDVPSSYLADAFFFQAEDGIRDRNVTGVQTCALPISGAAYSVRGPRWLPRPRPIPESSEERSEERRVGKEWRSWWGPNDLKRKSERQ